MANCLDVVSGGSVIIGVRFSRRRNGLSRCTIFARVGSYDSLARLSLVVDDTLSNASDRFSRAVDWLSAWDNLGVGTDGIRECAFEFGEWVGDALSFMVRMAGASSVKRLCRTSDYHFRVLGVSPQVKNLGRSVG